MPIEKKNKYPFETLDTTTIFIPLELLAYHSYRHSNAKKKSKIKMEKKELEIVKYYLRKENNEK